MFLMKVTMATFRNFSSYIVKQHSSSSPLLILTSPCIIIKTIFRGTKRYLSIHHSHNRDDDGNDGKKNVKGADDDCPRPKTCAAETFLPPVVRFHHRLLHFQIVFSTIFKELGVYFTEKRNSWKERMKETAFLRGVRECLCCFVLVLPGKVKVRRSHPRHICAKFELRLQTFASVSFH